MKTITLRTVCGCTKTIHIPNAHLPSVFKVPYHTNPATFTDEVDVVAPSFKVREFLWTGRHDDHGNAIYLEDVR